METVTNSKSSAPPSLFDPVVMWPVLREHLDSMTIAHVAGQLGLARLGDRMVQCPRYECRASLPLVQEKFWMCAQCGAAGGGAMLVTARAVGWAVHDGEDDAELRRDFGRIAQEVLQCGLVDLREQKWIDFYGPLGDSGWSADRRGIFEGEDRKKSVVALTRALRKCPDLTGEQVLRQVWASNCAYCRPPLNAKELAAALAESAA